MAIRILYPMIGDKLGGSHLSTFHMTHFLDNDMIPVFALHEIRGKVAKHLKLLDFHDISHIYCPKSTKEAFYNPFKTLKSIFLARKYLLNNQFDIVHCDDGAIRIVWFFASMLTKIPYVHAQHTIVAPGFEKNIIYPMFAACLSCSETVQKSLPRNTISRVIYPCIDFSPVDKPYADRNIDALFLANIRHQKRPFVFLNLLRMYKKKHPERDVQFQMIGDYYGDIEREVMSFVEKHDLKSNIKFLSFTDDIASYLADAKILVVPAVGDAFGRTIIEAMASHTAVLAAKSGGHQEIIKHNENGVLVEPDDMSEFLKGFEKLTHDMDFYNQIVSKAEMHAENFLDKQKIGSDYSDIYKEVCR